MYSSIDIDFDVFKELTARLPSPDSSYNDVLRDMLDLTNQEFKPYSALEMPSAEPGAWQIKGKVYPAGTQFRAKYKGLEYHGIVRNGALEVNDKHFGSPSAAAGAITGTSVNGWRFWDVRRPGEKGWTLMSST